MTDTLAAIHKSMLDQVGGSIAIIDLRDNPSAEQFGIEFVKGDAPDCTKPE